MTKDILHLMDVIDAGMPLDQQNVWKRRALAAIQSCANPHMVTPQFMLWLVTGANVPGMDTNNTAPIRRIVERGLHDQMHDIYDAAMEADVDRRALALRREMKLWTISGAEDHALDILRTALSDDIHAAADCANLSADAFGDSPARAEFCDLMGDKLIELLAAAQVVP
jgi:hypothetical protein